MYFAATKEVTQPLPLLFLVTGALVALLWWRLRGEPKGRRTLALLTAAYAALGLACTEAGAYLPLGALEWPYPPKSERPSGAAAMVVLSGGIDLADAVRPRAEPSEDTVVRCLHAAALYRQGPPCPVVVTGGRLAPGASVPPIASLMRDLLVRLGVRPDDLVVEPNARTTYENATESRKLLEARGLDRSKLLLVTEAYHMPRALGCFRSQGLDVIPAPCHYQATVLRPHLGFFLPSVKGVRLFQTAWHEWLGLAWYRLRGRA